jgi:hypothetical protein
MPRRLRTVDVCIVIALLVVSTGFLYKADYLAPLFPSSNPSVPPVDSNTSVPTQLPPTSLVPSVRRDVSGDDEGGHFDSLRVTREWWYFTVVFNDSSSSLKDWAAAVGFAHLAPGDLLGTAKPDLLAISLLDPTGEAYGGLVNKPHYLGIVRDGTLVASTPGVKLTYESSWVEGTSPIWHVHAEDPLIDSDHTVVFDLDYQARALPVWTQGSKAFDLENSTIASYVFLDCMVSGTVEIDGVPYTVHGVGTFEHSWSPHAVTRAEINGWDWLSLSLDNGWMMYVSNYLPVPQALTERVSKLDPFGTVLITTDHGDTVTELKSADLKVTVQDEKVFPLVKMPSSFSLDASPSLNPSFLVSQSLLLGSHLSLTADGDIVRSVNKIWQFPTFVGMKIGYVHISGMVSWIDSDGSHSVPFSANGVSWSMRALL